MFVSIGVPSVSNGGGVSHIAIQSAFLCYFALNLFVLRLFNFSDLSMFIVIGGLRARALCGVHACFSCGVYVCVVCCACVCLVVYMVGGVHG